MKQPVLMMSNFRAELVNLVFKNNLTMKNITGTIDIIDF